MKALWVVENFPPSTGGVQNYVYNTVLSMKRFECVVLSKPEHPVGDGKISRILKSNGHKIYRRKIFRKNMSLPDVLRHPVDFAVFCCHLVKIAKHENVDAVIFGHVNFFYLVSIFLLKQIINKPVCMVFHGEDIPVVPMKSNHLMKLLINRLDFCICNSDYTKNRLIRFAGNKLNITIAYPGVRDKFFSNVNAEVLKEQKNINRKKVIYTVGRLDRRKGHEAVIRALPDVIKEIPEAVYLIGGTGPHLEYLSNMVKKLGLSEFVFFCGFIPDDDIVNFHRVGDVFVMPNRILDDGDTEGFGIVFMEAGASGKPVIGGDAGGAVEAVVNGINGYIVNSLDISELTQKIVYLLKNTDEAEIMGNNGRNRAFAEFRWHYLIAKLEKGLERVLNEYKR